MRVAAAILPIALAGCSFGFESAGEVIDLRVLAVRSEPAELVVDAPLPPTVTVSALVVDPRDPSRIIPYEWRACVPGATNGAPDEGGGQPTVPAGDVDTTGDARCPEVDDSNRLAAGEAAGSAMTVTVPIPASLTAAVAGASAQGLPLSLYVNAQLKLLDGTSPLYAIKRVPVSPAIPAGRVANENPALVGLLFDGELWDPATPLRLRHGTCAEKQTAVDRTRPGEEVQVCGHRITPVFDDAAAETYTVRTYAGSDLTLRERLRFAWFVEHGSLTYPTTEQPGSVGAPRYDPISTTWLEPPERPQPGTATLWVVLRDGRGGTSWERREIAFE